MPSRSSVTASEASRRIRHSKPKSAERTRVRIRQRCVADKSAPKIAREKRGTAAGVNTPSAFGRAEEQGTEFVPP